MLWWMLLRDQTKREQMGVVVDLCAKCEALRIFRVVRISKSNAIGGTQRYQKDEKWCGACGVGSDCDPMRYARLLRESDAHRGSERQALEATNPGLAARLDFIERCQRDAAQGGQAVDPASLQELMGSLKRMEAQGHDTSALLRQLDTGRPPTRDELAALLSQLRAQQAHRSRAETAAADDQRREKRAKWQTYALGAAAGTVAGLIALLVVAQPPWLVVGGALMAAVAGAIVGGTVLDAKVIDRLGAALPAGLLAITISLIAWFGHTRSLHVDNPSLDALTVFINERSETLQPGERVKLYIAKSESYQLGWALVGEQPPQQWLQTPIEDDAIYNPGSSACYWLGIDVYSVSRTLEASNDEPWGPQPIRELYMFDKIDNWFENNPDEVQLPSGSSTARRFALLYDNDCMRFTVCDLQVRQELQSCRARAFRGSDQNAPAACLARAEQQCPSARPATP